MLLISGCVKLTQYGHEGSQVILRLAGEGDVIGVLGLCEGSHCSTGQAMDASIVLIWEKEVFDSLLDRYPALHRNLIRTLDARLREMNERFREVSTQKVSPRVSSQLVRLFEQVGKPVAGNVLISLSRAELAQLTGTTLFTISRLLSHWTALGIVSPGRETVLIRDFNALVQLSHEAD
jgi:CRP-like cAMP-binding protein